ncbi:acetolactate synthase-1/2/3 large subunit [Kibdelosporangium banguiense]|uniref:Acetolactate synthase-1/2/3 large subunit n=1 Tax=Kibdelosporangium banguiense TaxID=1365924 RepID=A0ABS4TV02_9PSEU|nr:acetolactate synthase large subunit [Kibdelosporangium banguiense]MBP2328198.1 acetolactate synthase-1/2/3 large subunit [Kibdelosporangium banguiense]
MANETFTGAEALVHAAAQSGVRVCFANPGTTEMPLVAALDQVPGVRAVLGLQENVCTGAADGYARITGSAAMTLLHLGPGLANGLANLHNARRANTPLVNIVGDHTSWHLPYDAPLTSDIAALAATVGTVHTITDRAGVGEVTRGAIDEAHRTLGVSTVIVPADYQQDRAPQSPAAPTNPSSRPVVGSDRVKDVAARLRSAGRALLLLGGNALTRPGQQAAARIAASTGAALYSETFPARAERGGGLPNIDRLPYFPETAAALLQDVDTVVVAGAENPVAYFGYEGIPSILTQPGTLIRLAGPAEDAEEALLELADLIGGTAKTTPTSTAVVPNDDETLTGQAIGQIVAACLPDSAIVSVEGGTSGYPFYTASASAAAHTVMTNTGGAIGQGLPCALGAAIAAPDRPIIALQSDGSGLYTAQALWTMSRERTNVIVLIAANHSYNVLRTELGRHGNAEFGPQAEALTSLADPRVDWVSLAGGFGVPANRATRVADLRHALTDAVDAGGPHLIEMAI